MRDPFKRTVPRRLATSFRFAAAMLLFAGCASARGKYVWVDDLPAEQAGAAQAQYRIGPNDLLMVQVFSHPEMSGRNKVRSDGNLSIGLLGDIEAVGKTPAVLARDIETQLDARKLVVSARVTITLDEAAPVRVSILGEVARPGLYSLEPGSGLSEALASSGGFTDFAHRDRLFVLRRSPELIRIRFSFAKLIHGDGNVGAFRLRTGDTIVVE